MHLRVGCICLKCVVYVLVVTLGMSGPICEWDVSALSVRYMFLLCVICSCCDSRHEGTHLRMYCVCLL